MRFPEPIITVRRLTGGVEVCARHETPEIARAMRSLRGLSFGLTWAALSGVGIWAIVSAGNNWPPAPSAPELLRKPHARQRISRKPEVSDQHVKVQLTRAELAALDARADASGLKRAAYIRRLILAEIGDEAAKPRPAAGHAKMVLAAEAHLLAMQVKRLGVTVGQLAQTGPLARAAGSDAGLAVRRTF